MNAARYRATRKPALSVRLMEATARAHEAVCDGDYVAGHYGYAYSRRHSLMDWWRGFRDGWRDSASDVERGCAIAQAGGFVPAYEQSFGGDVVRTAVGEVRSTREEAQRIAWQRGQLIRNGVSVYPVGAVFETRADGTLISDAEGKRWFVAVAVDSFLADVDFDAPYVESQEAAWTIAWQGLGTFIIEECTNGK